jgi:hypothetical protein
MLVSSKIVCHSFIPTSLLQVVEASNGSDKTSGLVIKYPGAPDMYDYERQAYGAGPPVGVGALLQISQQLGKAADGFIATTSTCVEPIGVPHVREFYGKRGKELFTIGMQAHEFCWANATPVPLSNERVKSFLDRAVGKYGKKSVLYISFGFARALLIPRIPYLHVIFRPDRSTSRLPRRSSSKRL